MSGNTISLLIACLMTIPLLGAETKLTLSDCIHRAVQANLTLQSQSLEKQQKNLDQRIAAKVFIPVFSMDQSFQSGSKLSDIYTVSGKLHSSTRYSLKSGVDRAGTIDYKTASFELTEPLLKNFGRRVADLDLELSRIDYRIAVELFRDELNSFIRTVADNYLNLCLDRQILVIQEKAYDRALKQYEDTRHDIGNGVLAEQEIYLVEENLISFESKKKDASHNIVIQEMELKRILEIGVADETSLIPVDSIEEAISPGLFSDSCHKMQLDNPVLKIKNLTMEKSNKNYDYYQNMLLPELNLYFKRSVSWPDSTTGSGRDASSDSGFFMELPFSNAPDRSSLDKSELDREITRRNFTEEKQSLDYELRKLFSEIEYQQGNLALRKKGTLLAEKKLEAETEKYRNGISTLADVVLFQREFESAQIDEKSIAVQLCKLFLKKRYLEGTLYQDYGIQLMDINSKL
ncbi:MAG: TolC family protein [Candidatus Wallbacteria bacterium]|nr:TolC family protein [Candidatus Wallbacteria bacterium]